MSTEQERLHRTSVAGNTVASVAGGAFGASKLRDLHAEQYPRAHKVALGHITAKAPKLVRVATGRPGFKTALVGSTAAATAAGARRYNDHRKRVAKADMAALGMVDDVALGAVKAKGLAAKLSPVKGQTVPPQGTTQPQGVVAKNGDMQEVRMRRARRGVKQAIHPPAVARKNVDSSAVRSIGYQRQTRRLAVEMHSKPGEPYTYRVPPKVAESVVNADSKGRAYSKQIRGQYEREPKVRLRDRARMAAHPVAEPVKKSAFSVAL